MSTKLIEVRFHFFDFIFKPLKSNTEFKNSKSILKACIDVINKERIDNQKAIVIDKYESRSSSDSRHLFVSSAAYSHLDYKYKCKIAVIRENKLPTLVDRTDYTLTPIQELGINEIAETTNFYIDVSGDHPVVCCEFNNNGPRINDIEYYFRQISRKYLNIAAACNARIHMKMPINEVLDSISDVLKFEIKVKHKRLAYLNNEVRDAFVANMTALAKTVEPNSIRIDAFFRERGKGNKTGKKNLPALNFVKRALKAIKTNSNIVDDFEDFTLEFERKDGTEGDFNLVKGKVEIVIDCPVKPSKGLNTKQLYELVKVQFDEFLLTLNN